VFKERLPEGKDKQDENKREDHMPREVEELMPELVALVLSHVDRVSFVASRFVCATWKPAAPVQGGPPPPAGARELQPAGGSKGLARTAPVGGDQRLSLAYLTCERAAGGGHVEVLQWARANGCPWDESTRANAAERGHLEVLEWARTNGCPSPTDQ
jgi:hypothetical protein